MYDSIYKGHAEAIIKDITQNTMKMWKTGDKQVDMCIKDRKYLEYVLKKWLKIWNDVSFKPYFKYSK